MASSKADGANKKAALLSSLYMEPTLFVCAAHLST
jgi:hypothetical protein